jgi:2-iminobutanoate/2-iminopropanoate deaminase
VAGGIEAETRQALHNVKAIIEAAGGRMEDIVKTTVFLADIRDFAAFNTVYAEFFRQRPPARSTVQAGALPVGARVEIEAIASWT